MGARPGSVDILSVGAANERFSTPEDLMNRRMRLLGYVQCVARPADPGRGSGEMTTLGDEQKRRAKA